MTEQDSSAEAERLCAEADELLRNGNPDEAARRLNFALDVLLRLRDTRSEAAVLELFARVHRATGQMAKAEQSVRAALACWMKLEDRAEEARVLGLLASLRISQGALSDGEFWLLSSLKVLRENGNRAGEADILRALSALYLRKGELAEAEDHARSAIELFRELKDKGGEARTEGTYAQMLMRRGAYREAYSAAQRCQDLFNEIGHKPGVTSGMQVRAAILRREGELGKAEKLLEEIVRQKREMKDVAGEAGAMNTLALVVMDHGDARLNEAERHLLRAIELFNSVNDTQNAALSQQNLADLYRSRGRIADAEVVLRDALKIHRRTGGIESQARTLNAIATALAAQGRLDEGLEAFDESLSLARQVKDHGLLVSMLCPWGEVMVLLGEADKAAAALEDALARDHPGEDIMLRQVLPLRVRIALASGDVKQAERVLAEAQERLQRQPEPMRNVMGANLDKVRAAASTDERLFNGFQPASIDAGLRHAILERLSKTSPGTLKKLDASIIEAMKA